MKKYHNRNLIILLIIFFLFISCHTKTVPFEKYPLPELYNGPTIKNFNYPIIDTFQIERQLYIKHEQIFYRVNTNRIFGVY